MKLKPTLFSIGEAVAILMAPSAHAGSVSAQMTPLHWAVTSTGFSISSAKAFMTCSLGDANGNVKGSHREDVETQISLSRAYPDQGYSLYMLDAGAEMLSYTRLFTQTGSCNIQLAINGTRDSDKASVQNVFILAQSQVMSVDQLQDSLDNGLLDRTISQFGGAFNLSLDGTKVIQAPKR